MIHSARFTCVLDTCVIYPIDIRDLLLWFAHFDLYRPKWSQTIFDELHNVMIQKGMPIEKANRQIERMNNAFPDAMVNNYEELITTLSLRDKRDCHVLAAAIKSDANLIVTNNLKDFDNEYLSRFGLFAKSADDFITDTIDLNTVLAKEAFMTMVAHRTNPSLDEYQILDILRKRGLVNSADYLHSLI
ncbi:MAG: PIN domain-containing protein [Cyclobacteriaceae bacterium]|jgi:predicted nucleic acid-binding protein